MSAPLGFNALAMALCPWKAFTRSMTTVTTTATAIPTSGLANRAGIWVFNAGSVNVFLGDANVGQSNEIILFPNQLQLLPFSDAVSLFGRTASSSAAVIAWEYLI